MENKNNNNDNQSWNPLTSKNISHKQVVISPRQSGSLIASTLIGVGVLTLPRVTASDAHEAAWLATLLGSIIAVVGLIIITKLGFRFPKKSIVSYSTIILGPKKKKWKVIGRILSAPVILGLIVFWTISTAMVARTFGEVVVTAVLLETPIEVIIGTMLLTALTLVMYDVEVLARVNELLFPIIVLPVLVIALSSFQSFELEYILPLWPALSPIAFLKGVLVTVLAYQGYEIITVFSAHTQITRKTMRYNIIGLLTAAFVYTLIVIAGVSVFGTEELALLMWPTLELVKVTQVPGLVLERLEGAFLGVWVAAVFTTTANVYYAASLSIAQFFGIKKRRWVAIAMLPIIFWLSLIPQNVHALFQWQEYIGYGGLMVGLVIPVFLYIVAIARKKGVKKTHYIEEHKDSQNLQQEKDDDEQT